MLSRPTLTCLAAVLLFNGRGQALMFQDSFDRAWDSQMRFINYKGWADGQDVSIGQWDGFLGSASTLVAYNYVDGFPYALGQEVQGNLTPNPSTPGALEELNGVLLVSSKNGRWDRDGNSGALLYKNVEGDFVAEIEVVSRDYWLYHSGGLMARVDNPGMDLSSENWVDLSHCPVNGVGNQARSIVDGAGDELAAKGYPADPFLQLERQGDTFFLRTSPDGIHWKSLPGLENGMIRADMPATLQVGVWQATHSSLIGTMMFDNFSIVPEPATVILLGFGALAMVCGGRFC